MAKPAAISVEGLSHTFTSGRQTLTTLENVNLEVAEGEFLSVIGPSGGGKTTLLRAIAGLLKPTTGGISVCGMSPQDASKEKKIGFISQDPALLPWRTVLENVRLPLEIISDKPDTKSQSHQELISSVGLGDFRNYYPHQLSGGMKQRVALARALALDPTVLLMDEPFGALDELTRNTMRYELIRLWEDSQKSVVFVTHSISEAVILSDRVVVMSSRPGRIVAEISIDLPRPRHESVEHSEGFVNYLRQIRNALSMGTALGTAAI